MKAYKGFNEKLQCRGYQYAVGETYKHDGEIAICGSGFHFCKDLVLCFEFYPLNEANRFCEVEIISTPIWDEVGHKGVASEIKIVREMSREEIAVLLDSKSNSGRDNSGYWNSGYRNSGNCNSGDRNSGNCNSGYWNSGNWNSGYWNSCDYETGAFNSEQSKTIRVFNKECDRAEWEKAEKPDFLFFTQKAGESYKEAFKRSWDEADKDHRELVKALPNFDSDVFFEISGVRV